ncbi:hypothetical protein D3C71_1118170 [compost metagenome]
MVFITDVDGSSTDRTQRLSLDEHRIESGEIADMDIWPELVASKHGDFTTCKRAGSQDIHRKVKPLPR